MDEVAPGAADEARAIAAGELSAPQRERLKRLIADTDKMQSAWRELAILRGKQKQILETDPEIWQSAIFRAAYIAPELPQQTKVDIIKRKGNLAAAGAQLANAARIFQEIAADDPQLAAQVGDMIRFYRIRYSNDPVTDILPESLNVIAGMVAALGHCVSSTATQSEHIGPAPVLGKKVRDSKARQTIVIRHIAQTVEWYCGREMYGTVAALASASLGKDKDISEATVRRSLR